MISTEKKVSKFLFRNLKTSYLCSVWEYKIVLLLFGLGRQLRISVGLLHPGRLFVVDLRRDHHTQQCPIRALAEFDLRKVPIDIWNVECNSEQMANQFMRWIILTWTANISGQLLDWTQSASAVLSVQCHWYPFPMNSLDVELLMQLHTFACTAFPMLIMKNQQKFSTKIAKVFRYSLFNDSSAHTIPIVMFANQ